MRTAALPINLRISRSHGQVMEDNTAAFPSTPEMDLEIFSFGCIIGVSNEWTMEYFNL